MAEFGICDVIVCNCQLVVLGALSTGSSDANIIYFGIKIAVKNGWTTANTGIRAIYIINMPDQFVYYNYDNIYFLNRAK